MRQTPDNHATSEEEYRNIFEAASARLSITSQPGHGTELTIHWEETGKKEDA